MNSISRLGTASFAATFFAFGCGAPPAPAAAEAPAPTAAAPTPTAAAKPAPAKPPPPPPATPLDGALPDTPPVVLQRTFECPETSCQLKKWLPKDEFGAGLPTGDVTAAAIWAHSIKKGRSLNIPRNKDFTVLGVVLKGEALMNREEGGGASKLGVWSAMRAPGAGITLRAFTEDVTIALILVTSEVSIQYALDQAEEKPFAVRWRRRKGKVEVKKLADVEDIAWGGGVYHSRVVFGGEGAPEASLDVGQLGVNGRIPEHAHDESWEHVGILQGAGTFTLAGKDHAVKAGSIMNIPKGQKHAFVASGNDPALVIRVFTPSGPEQRYAKIAAEEKAKAEKKDAPAPKADQPAKPAAAPPAGKTAPKSP